VEIITERQTDTLTGGYITRRRQLI